MNKITIVLIWVMFIMMCGITFWAVQERMYSKELEKLLLSEQRKKEMVQPTAALRKCSRAEQLRAFIGSVTNVPPRWEERDVKKVSFSNNRESKIHLLLENYILLDPVPQFQQRKVSLRRLNELKRCTCTLNQPCWISLPCTNATCECCRAK